MASHCALNGIPSASCSHCRGSVMESWMAELLANGKQVLKRESLLAAGWSIGFEACEHRMGHCHYGSRRIFLSRPRLTVITREERQEVLLHEVAHALAGPKAGHGPQWLSQARRLGASGAVVFHPKAEAA